MAHGTPYKPLIDSAIIHLQEAGVVHKLHVKWWKQKRGGGRCQKSVVKSAEVRAAKPS